MTQQERDDIKVEFRRANGLPDGWTVGVWECEGRVTLGVYPFRSEKPSDVYDVTKRGESYSFQRTKK